MSRLVGRLIGGAAAVGYDCAFIAETSFPCFASKLRLPKLLASSADGQQVHLWDLVERKVETLAVPEFVDVSEDGQVYYVELDDEVIYLAGQHGVLVVRPDLGVDDPLRSRIWPPKAPEGMRHLLEHAWYSRECEGVGWEAVHHGGSHLIGISRRSDQDDLAKLVWTCDKRSIWGDDDGAEADRKTAVLVIVSFSACTRLEGERADQPSLSRTHACRRAPTRSSSLSRTTAPSSSCMTSTSVRRCGCSTCAPPTIGTTPPLSCLSP